MTEAATGRRIDWMVDCVADRHVCADLCCLWADCSLGCVLWSTQRTNVAELGRDLFIDDLLADVCQRLLGVGGGSPEWHVTVAAAINCTLSAETLVESAGARV